MNHEQEIKSIVDCVARRLHPIARTMVEQWVRWELKEGTPIADVEKLAFQHFDIER